MENSTGLYRVYFCLFDSLSHSQQFFSFVVKGLGWTSTKQGLMCLAQGHNAVPPVRLEPPLNLTQALYH